MNLSAINKVTKGNTRTNGISDFAELRLSKIYVNPMQPRKEFNTELLQELAEDIKANGLLQPIIVVKKDDGYMIVGGERRYRAIRVFTDFSTIKAHIIKASEEKILELALIENIQREDLTDFEIAVHIGKLWSSKNYATKSNLAKAIGKSQSYISKAFGCLRLDESIIEDIEAGKRDIGLSVLEEIARVKDKNTQKEVYDKYLSKDITRDDISSYKKPQKKDKKKFVSYGFGTVNDMGNFISLSKGDLEGRIAINTEGFVKHSDYSNYKITIEEI